jgi:acetylglutamate kinase
MEIVEMVLAGSINKSIVSHINEAGGKAVGLCGKDGNMVTATKATRTMVDPGSNIEKVVDLGFVGEPDKVDLTLLNQLIGYELIPVLAPLASSADGKTYNVNADTFAGAVAGALKAKRLLLLTDVPGVLDKSKKLIPELSIKDARKLIADGTISGGMIPKVETCIYSLEQASKAWSSSTARHRMRSCSNCSPIRHGNADPQVMRPRVSDVVPASHRAASAQECGMNAHDLARRGGDRRSLGRARPRRPENLQPHELCRRGRHRHRRQDRHRDARLVPDRSGRLPRGRVRQHHRRSYSSSCAFAAGLWRVACTAKRHRQSLRCAKDFVIAGRQCNSSQTSVPFTEIKPRMARQVAYLAEGAEYDDEQADSPRSSAFWSSRAMMPRRSTASTDRRRRTHSPRSSKRAALPPMQRKRRAF